MENTVSKIILLGLTALVSAPAHAAVTVDFDAATDITNNFREIRTNTNDPVFQNAAGSNGSTVGYANITASADNGAVRLAYDADGAGAGTNTFSTGFVATDIRWTNANQSIGFFFGPSTTDAIGWRMRLDNSGTLENGVADFGVNNTNNFSLGTKLTTTSATAFDNGAGTPTLGASTDTYSSANLTPGNWYSMRLDFGLNGSGERTLQLRVWDNILDGNGVGTGTLRWNQSLDIVGSAYSGAGEVGLYTANFTGMSVDIDNFTLVPEPSTYAALLGLCAIGFVAIRRRR